MVTCMWFVLAVVVVGLAWLVFVFNTLTRRRNGVDEAWSTVGVELARRHDLVPALVQAVRGYVGFEADVLQRVTDSRARAASGTDGTAETALTDAVHSLFAVAEGYPDLKSSENFQSLQIN